MIPDLTPTEIFLSGIVVTIVGFWIKSQIETFVKRDDALEARANRGDEKVQNWAERLAAIEVTVAHVAADQEAHRRAAEDLNQIKVWAGKVDERLAAIGRQNRAIWDKLSKAA